MHLIKRLGAMVTAVLACTTILAGQGAAALAATLHRPPAGTYVMLNYNNDSLYTGVVAVGDAGEQYYCIEAGAMLDYAPAAVSEMADSEAARRLAWIMEQYRDGDSITQAAIAVVAQDHAGVRVDGWSAMRQAVAQQYPAAIARAEAMWNESAHQVAASAVVEQSYAEAQRTGSVNVSVQDTTGAALAGVPFTVTLQGPAVFANGSTTMHGVSSGSAQQFSWTATGQGDVQASTSYDVRHVSVMDATQRLITLGSTRASSGSAVHFAVRKGFSPQLKTVTAAKIVDAGDTVADDVTSGLIDEQNVWPEGVEVRASGYYFDGLDVNVINGGIEPNDGESADEFLARLASLGYLPAAYGSASFTGVGQTVRVEAMREVEGSDLYRVSDSGGFGTWVWAIRAAEQSDETKGYIKHDWVSAFGEVSETNVNRSRVTVASTVTEHTAHIDSTLSDTITVSGFPADHGSFAGSETAGFGADNPIARVSVWWSGDEHDPEQDDQYIPSSEAVPTEDDHHRRIGTWDIPAANGTFNVGAGSLDAHGNPITITAQRHGWYVFVWEFDGDDRVMPAASAYNDAWERVRVVVPETPEEPEEPEEPETPEQPALPPTGAGVGPIVLCAVAALAVGAVMLACIKRRS